MRKLKLQMQMSIDGFVAGPEGQLDWIKHEMDPKQLEVLKGLTEGMDTILMGRAMAPGFVSYWENVVNTQPESPEYPYAKIFVDTPKIVFSKSVSHLAGENIRVENSDLVTVVNKLKSQRGKDLIVYGGASFVASLIENNLIDELNLFISPTAIGKGLRIFKSHSALKLERSSAFSNGIVLNRYVRT